MQLDSCITDHFVLVCNLKEEKLEGSFLGAVYVAPLIFEDLCAFRIQSLLDDSLNVQAIHHNFGVQFLYVLFNKIDAFSVGSIVALNSQLVRTSARFNI